MSNENICLRNNHDLVDRETRNAKKIKETLATSARQIGWDLIEFNLICNRKFFRRIYQLLSL